MEVHQPAHTPRKKWTHYFWQFLMLFLAVFCGFLAENQREHLVEHRREKQYIVSMIEDLKTDTAKLENVIQENQTLLVPLANLRRYFDEIDKGYGNVFLRNQYGLQGFEDFHPTDRTIQQLKNGGNMRLIRNLAASDSIMEYDAAVQDALLESADNNKAYHVIREKGPSGLQSSKESFLLTTDKVTLGKYYNEVCSYRGISFNVTEGKVLKHKATTLIDFLGKEYHLK